MQDNRYLGVKRGGTDDSGVRSKKTPSNTGGQCYTAGNEDKPPPHSHNQKRSHPTASGNYCDANSKIQEPISNGLRLQESTAQIHPHQSTNDKGSTRRSQNYAQVTATDTMSYHSARRPCICRLIEEYTGGEGRKKNRKCNIGYG